MKYHILIKISFINRLNSITEEKIQINQLNLPKQNSSIIFWELILYELLYRTVYLIISSVPCDS